MAEAAYVLARESVALQPLPQNVRRARRTVADTLIAADRADLAETAALVTSEIVTNAVLHAGSDIWLTVTVTAAGALVEVEDHNPHRPVPRSYDAAATTGRGMALVDELVSDFGVRHIADTGKVVWFTLGAPRAEELPTRGVRASAAAIALLGVPVGLFCTWQQAADGLLREVFLARFSRPAGDSLAQWNLAKEAFGELALAGAAAFALRDSATSHVNLSVGVRPAADLRFSSLRRVLDMAAQLAADGLLLAPPSQPEMAALRNWCCDQVLLQLAGAPATPWRPGSVADVPLPGPVLWNAAAVTGSSLAVVAADDANRLIAVSGPAAELLGWPADELVGQRIVAIVPPAAKEAHIAGFVRYLLSGDGRIIGAPVQVNALRRDGTEVAVTLLITMATQSGRLVFLATLTPVDVITGESVDGPALL